MHDKVIFDDAILDARRWKARQFEATGMRQLEALARANELAADAAAIAAATEAGTAAPEGADPSAVAAWIPEPPLQDAGEDQSSAMDPDVPVTGEGTS